MSDIEMRSSHLKQKEIIKRFWDSSYLGGLNVPGGDVYAQSTFNGNDISVNREDPTFIGFSIDFDWISGQNTLDYDNLPNGLFYDADDPSSTQNYLLRNGYKKEAQMINRFKDGLKKIATDKPWYFTKITGLDSVYKVDVTKATRASTDTKIIISMLENLNMEISYLFDLYTKAVWDSKAMRWRVPDNMRMFNMYIRIFDIRDFRVLLNNADDINSLETQFPSNPEQSLYDIKSSYSPMYNGMFDVDNDIKAKLKEDTKNTYKDATYKFKDELELPILELQLGHCEFTVLEDGNGISEISSSGNTEQMTREIGIRIGKIKEVGYYNGFKYIGEDLINSAIDSVIDFSQSADVYKTAKRVTEGTTIGDSQQQLKQNIYDGNPPLDVKNNLKGTKKDSLLENIGEAVFQRAKSELNSAINKVLLGNIYGITPTDLQNMRRNLFKKDPEASGKMPSNINFNDTEQNTEVLDNIGHTSSKKKPIKTIGNIYHKSGVKKEITEKNIGFSGKPSN